MYMYKYILSEEWARTPQLWKKELPRTKTGLAEKDVKWNGWPMPPRFKSMMNSLQNIVISDVKAPDVDGIKIFDKDEQITKH